MDPLRAPLLKDTRRHHDLEPAPRSFTGASLAELNSPRRPRDIWERLRPAEFKRSAWRRAVRGLNLTPRIFYFNLYLRAEDERQTSKGIVLLFPWEHGTPAEVGEELIRRLCGRLEKKKARVRFAEWDIVLSIASSQGGGTIIHHRHLIPPKGPR